MAVPIIYNGGSYGSYLYWILNSITTTDKPLISPFTDKGNSHNSPFPNLSGYFIGSILQSRTSVNSNFIKIHPKTEAKHNIIENINTIIEVYGKSILLYPSKDTYLLHCNNYVYKIWDDLWKGPLGYINLENLYNNFPVNRTTPLTEVPAYIIREWLSYNFFPAIDDQIGWFLPDHYNNPNCLIIFLEDLLYDHVNTLEKIKQFCNLSYTRPLDELTPYHNTNLSLQRFLTQDQMSKNIMESITNNTNFVWTSNDLTIITEAWIQRWIREQSIDFKCHNLNTFPTSTVDLLKLF